MIISRSGWPQPLQPRLDNLRREEVLVQAWKKASAYIRYHNWFSDTLELDWSTINLPSFLNDIASTLKSSAGWESDPLRFIPAPKTQPGWQPASGGNWKPPKDVPLRPLAHVTLRDQVVATAIMLCLADRVETRQGDPRLDIESAENRRAVVSYGNRLFCDTDQEDGELLRHRWGSAKLYRKYFQDYRNFLKRPEAIARGLLEDAATNPDSSHGRPFIVCTDLSKFYDRVRPNMLTHALEMLSDGPEEQSFFTFANSMLSWGWHPRDRLEVERYQEAGDIQGLSNSVALPQGLVSAGFFANAVLLDLDELVVMHFDGDILPGVRLHDYCRYVDDIRMVVSTTTTADAGGLGNDVRKWLQEGIDEAVPGLVLEPTKTKTIGFGEGTPQMIRVGATMDRIQTAVSGGFDAIEGERILDTVQSLIRSQPAAFADDADESWYLSPVPDVRDNTLARFCAQRFRTTYRSLRPLLDADDASRTPERSYVRSQRQLDDQAQSFALVLIDRWMRDPANIRVLRIGLDIWPHEDALDGVLGLLRKLVWSGEGSPDAVRVAWYCLSEVFRAGATETGVVESSESLHGNIDIADYRALLREEAKRVMSAPTLPWYLRQQAFLFLIATGHVSDLYGVVSDLPGHYGDLVSFLLGDSSDLGPESFATAAVAVRQSLRAREEALALVGARLYGRPPGELARKLSAIGVRDPSFLDEILAEYGHLEEYVDDWLRLDIGRLSGAQAGVSGDRRDGKSLKSLVEEDPLMGPLRNELALLRFAKAFLNQWSRSGREIHVITPTQVSVEFDDALRRGPAHVQSVTIAKSTVSNEQSIYRTPTWCPAAERWRLQLGYLLRFILTGGANYTRPIRPPAWREGRLVYRPPEAPWYLRRYGFYNGQRGFGDDWLPISDWAEDLLMALLRWPGCHAGRLASHIDGGLAATLKAIRARISWLEQLEGHRAGLPILPMSFRRAKRESSIHACVAQTVIPEKRHFEASQCDPQLSQPDIRRDHRQHLAATLEAVRAMVNARASHSGGEPRLDWLILPELAVHPQDIRTHLIPFARVYKAVIVAGLTYHEAWPGGPLINSALWLMPEYSPQYGLQIRTRRQGKQYLARDEKSLDVEGFRPCQWLIEYPCAHSKRNFRLTASVCYDATDLRLASDLRDKSDVFAVPALNQDVKTFDRMAIALHYHMFQLIVVANNGGFGGSNAYWPTADRHLRQVFHLHGQPQMSIAFLEIDQSVLDRHSGGDEWKQPPAGLRPLVDKDEGQ